MKYVKNWLKLGIIFIILGVSETYAESIATNSTIIQQPLSLMKNEVVQEFGTTIKEYQSDKNTIYAWLNSIIDVKLWNYRPNTYYTYQTYISTFYDLTNLNYKEIYIDGKRAYITKTKPENINDYNIIANQYKNEFLMELFTSENYNIKENYYNDNIYLFISSIEKE